MRARVGIVAVLTVAAWSFTTTTASADPEGLIIDQQCGDESFEVVVVGRGNWTAGRIVGGGVFIPTTFEDFTGIVRNQDSEVVDEFTDEFTESKGQSAKNKDIVECTFTFTDVSDGSDPEFPEGWTFTGTGGISGYFVS